MVLALKLTFLKVAAPEQLGPEGGKIDNGIVASLKAYEHVF